MTEFAKATAEFKIDSDTSDKATELIIDWQDCDKFWCPSAPIEILINNKRIFKEKYGYKKRG